MSNDNNSVELDIDEDQFMESYYAPDWANAFGESTEITICGVKFILSGPMPLIDMRWATVKEVAENPKDAREIMNRLNDEGKIEAIQEKVGDSGSFHGDGNLVVSNLDFLEDKQ